MKRALLLCLFLLSFLISAFAQAPAAASLHGIVTDPSAAVVPNAVVQLRGPGGEQRQTTNVSGEYSFSSLRPGKYIVRVIAKGFTVNQRLDFDISGPATLDVQLTIQAEAQVMNVEDEINKVSADPANNGGALVLKDKDLDALSDDPDELAQQLQAMAGPGAGPAAAPSTSMASPAATFRPNPPSVKSASTPTRSRRSTTAPASAASKSSPGRAWIPLHGNVFGQYNSEDLNSRSPLFDQSSRPPYKQDFFGFSLTGPIKKNKASFSFDGNYRSTTENAFVLATDLNANLVPQTINQAVLTPLSFLTLSPRVDYSITQNNTLTVRYQYTRVSSDDQGVGGFNLASRAYDTGSTENTLQVTDSILLNTHLVNETRFQFMRSATFMNGGSNDPALIVVARSRVAARRWAIPEPPATTGKSPTPPPSPTEPTPSNGAAACARPSTAAPR